MGRRANDALPIDWRFRTGGGGSVRGYPIKALGPRGWRRHGQAGAGAGQRRDTSIGRPARLATGAVCRRRHASDPLAKIGPRLGLGAGLRWDSPIGPVGLDIARGQYTKQWQWNLSRGASF